jgi:hypothetical protein
LVLLTALFFGKVLIAQIYGVLNKYQLLINIV